MSGQSPRRPVPSSEVERVQQGDIWIELISAKHGVEIGVIDVGSGDHVVGPDAIPQLLVILPESRGAAIAARAQRRSRGGSPGGRGGRRGGRGRGRRGRRRRGRRGGRRRGRRGRRGRGLRGGRRRGLRGGRRRGRR